MHSKDEMDKAIKELSRIKGIKFRDLNKICEKFFARGSGKKGSSHVIFKTPWPGDPRINIQKIGNEAKPYQVRQVIAALEKLRDITRST